jgi:hypothetical protein
MGSPGVSVASLSIVPIVSLVSAGCVADDHVPHGGVIRVLPPHMLLATITNRLPSELSRHSAGGNLKIVPSCVQPSGPSSSAIQHAPAPQMPSLPCGSLMPTLMFAGSSSVVSGNVHVSRSSVTRLACEIQLSTSKHSFADGSRLLLSDPDHGPG